MNRIKCYSDQKINLTDDDHRSRITISSNTTDSLVSSVILSMGPLSINSNDNQSTTGTIQKRHSFRNTSLCKKCQKFNPLNQSNTCPNCHQDQLSIQSEPLQLTSIVKSQSFNVNNKLQNENKTTEIKVLNENKSEKKLHDHVIMRLIHRSSSHSESPSISSESCLYSLLLHPKLPDDVKITESPSNSSESSLYNLLPHAKLSDGIKITESLPSPPPQISAPSSVYLSSEHINQYKQRQIELDRDVKKLIENLKIKYNENLNQISKYWSYLKRKLLEEFQSNSTRYQLFNNLSKSSFSSNKQYEDYFEENDELKATLQVLSTKLIIVHDKYPLSTIIQLFDYEEKTMLENLKYQLDFLISSYIDELTIIREVIHCYQNSIDEEKHINWIKIVKIDYPLLKEKIANEFSRKIPQIELILMQMLQNMKKHLFNMDINLINKDK